MEREEFPRCPPFNEELLKLPLEGKGMSSQDNSGAAVLEENLLRGEELSGWQTPDKAVFPPLTKYLQCLDLDCSYLSLP